MQETLQITFDDNKVLAALYGEQNGNLSYLQSKLGVGIAARGSKVEISGGGDKVFMAKNVLEALYSQAARGLPIGQEEADAAIRFASVEEIIPLSGKGPGEELVIKTRKKTIIPRSPGQKAYVKSLLSHDMVFATGPAGTGKTYLAVAVAVLMYLNHKVEKIILSRPAVEAGERLGFLPGDLKEKIDPYLRPLYDALHDMMPADMVKKCIENNEIEIAPLAFMRGRTLSNAYVILDEAQNTTPTQMKMFLTRLGVGSRMVVTGDLSQVDLPKTVQSGLKDASGKLSAVKDIANIKFTDADIVRHPLAAKIVQAYDEAEAKSVGEDEF